MRLSKQPWRTRRLSTVFKSQAALSAAVRPVVEGLERRQLLDGSVSEYDGTTWRIEGTTGTDTIIVESHSANEWYIFINDASRSHPFVRSKSRYKFVIEALGGNDDIFTADIATVGANENVETTILGGDGHDSLNDFSSTTGLLVVNPGPPKEYLPHGAGRDIYYGGLAIGDGDDKLYGRGGDDFLFGGRGEDSVDGGDGDDSLAGGLNEDTLVGAGGEDTANYSDWTDTVSVTLAGSNEAIVTLGNGEIDRISKVENVIGGSGNDTITGDGAANSIDGGLGNDQISGGDGDDTLVGDSGNDTISGNGGSGDVVNFSYRTSGGVHVTLGATATASDETDQLGTGIERIVGSNFDDLLTGGSGSNVIWGGKGRDTIYGLENDDSLYGNLNDTTASGDVGDVIYGGDDDDLISGEEGDDDAEGGDGNDTLIGGAGADELHGQVGDDRLEGGDGGDVTLNGGAGSDVIQGQAGDDNLIGGAGGDTIAGGVGRDTILGEGGHDEISGGYLPLVSPVPDLDIEDSIQGGEGNDAIIGDDGDDTIEGGDGDDSLLGNGGADQLHGQAGLDYLDGGHGNDSTLNGGAQSDTVVGGAGNDNLIGGTDSDVLRGGDGNDRLEGAGGGDELDGQAGIDRIDYSGWLYRVLVTVNNEAGNVGSTDDHEGSLELVRNVESVVGSAYGDLVDASSFDVGVTVIGNAGDDTLIGGSAADSIAGDAGDNVIDGNGGSDTLTVGDGNDHISASDSTTSVTLIGGAGNDTLIGGSAGDSLDGDGGNNVFEGRGGNDTIIGSGGVDTVRYGSATGPVVMSPTGAAQDGHGGVDSFPSGAIEHFVGGPWNDILNFSTASGFAVTLEGGAGNDSIIGGAQADSLDGGGGNDTLIGNGGIDTMKGGAGADTADYSGAPATVNITLGGMSWDGTGATDNHTANDLERVIGGNHDDSINAEAATFSVTLVGGGGADLIQGGSAADSLKGGAGDDTLVGKAGDDAMAGGVGADRFSSGTEKDNDASRQWLESGGNFRVEDDWTIAEAGAEAFAYGGALQASSLIVSASVSVPVGSAAGLLMLGGNYLARIDGAPSSGGQATAEILKRNINGTYSVIAGPAVLDEGDLVEAVLRFEMAGDRLDLFVDDVRVVHAEGVETFSGALAAGIYGHNQASGASAKIEDFSVGVPPVPGSEWVTLPTGGAQVVEIWNSVQAVTLVQSGDFDGDGRMDVAGFHGGRWLVSLSLGADGFAEPQTWLTHGGWTNVLVGDFNGDGRADLAGRTEGQWSVALSRLTREGFNEFAVPAWTVAISGPDVATGDFNGDGRIDLVSGNPNDGTWVVYLATGTEFAAQATWAELGGSGLWNAYRVGDFDGDGRDDLALHAADSRTRIGLSSGRGFLFRRWDPYGGDGFIFAAGQSSPPVYSEIAIDPSASVWGWNGASVEPGALEIPNSSDRLAATWYASDYFDIDVRITDGQSHSVSLYVLDYDSVTRAQTVEVLDGETNEVLDTHFVSNFSSGKYLTWTIAGHVKFRIIRTAGANAVVSGLFFDAPRSAVPVKFEGTDSTTRGDWLAINGGADFLVGKFDEDDLDDLAGRLPQSQKWDIAFSTGERFKSQSRQVDKVLSDVRVGDFDGNGYDDLIGQDGDTRDWYLGAFGETAFETGYWATSVISPGTEGPLVGNFSNTRSVAAELLQFVYNRIEYRPYYGFMKGAEATRETRAGNAWDQSALLVEMLRERGIEARYATGEIEAGPADIANWLGVKDQDAAMAVLKAAGLEPEIVGQGIRFKHAWVEARLDGSDAPWKAMDPSWKNRDARDVPTVPVSYDPVDYRSQIRRETPLEYYERRLMEELPPGTSLADLVYGGEIIRKRFYNVPDAPEGYAVVAGTTVRSEERDTLQTHRVRVHFVADVAYLKQVRASTTAGTVTEESALTQLTDGNPSTSWSFPALDNGRNFGVELGQQYSIDSIRILWDDTSTIPTANASQAPFEIHGQNAPLDWEKRDFVLGREGRVDSMRPIPGQSGLGAYATVLVKHFGAPHSGDWTINEFQVFAEVFNQEFVVPDMSTEPITIGYAPGSSAGFVRPELRLGGELIAVSPIEVRAEAAAMLTVEHLDADSEEAPAPRGYNYERKTGQPMAISLGAGQYSDKSLMRLQAEANEAAIGAYDGQANAHESQEKLLGLLGMNYFHETASEGALVAGLSGMIAVFPRVQSGLMTGDSSLQIEPTNDYRWELQNPIFNGKVTTDNPGATGRLLSISGATDVTHPDLKGVAQLLGDNGSALEHHLLESALNAESISTIKGIAWARSQPVEGVIPVYTISRPKFAASKAVTASANEDDESNVVDADLSTIWSVTSTISQSIYVDLGQSRQIKGVQLRWGKNHAIAYDIEWTDDLNEWPTEQTPVGANVYHKSNGSASPFVLTEINSVARYVRIRMYTSSGTTFDLVDLEVYGEAMSTQEGSIDPAAAMNWEALQLSPEVKVEVRKAVDSGHTVVVPKTNVTMGSWTGAVWLEEQFWKDAAVLNYPFIRTGETIAAGGATVFKANDNARSSWSDQNNAAHQGDPVNVRNGSLSHEEQDISIPAPGLPLTFGRHYESSFEEDRGMGMGWLHTYSHYLSFERDGSGNITKATWTTSQAERHEFRKASGGYVLPDELHGSFTENAGIFTYREKDGRKFTFDSLGQLTSIEDRKGNALNLSYTEGKLQTVQAGPGPGGPSLTFAYTNSKVTSVTDSTRRTWKYEYNTATGPASAQDTSKSVTSLTAVNSVVTAVAAGHGHLTGQMVMIAGAVNPAFNGYFKITRIDDDTFTFENPKVSTVGVNGAGASARTQKVHHLAAAISNVSGEVSSANTNLTVVESLVTVTLAGHGFATGDVVRISGASNTSFNGYFRVTVSSADVFTYVVEGLNSGSASGSSIKAQKVQRMEYGYYNSGRLYGLMKTIHDVNDDGTHSYEYYPNRRAFSTTDSEGNEEFFSYDLFHNRTIYTNPRGETVEHHFNSASNHEGLVLHWGLDEPNEFETATDGSGLGRHGQLTGSPQWESAVIGGGMQFNGAADQVTTQTGLSWTPTDFTVSFWLRPSNLTNYNQIIGANGDWGGFHFTSSITGSVYVGTDTASRLSPATSTKLGPGTVELDRWQFFTFTFDTIEVQGGPSERHAKLYKDGVELASTTNMAAPAVWNSFGILDVDGAVDDLRVYRRALPPAEILALQEETELTINEDRTRSSVTKERQLVTSTSDELGREESFTYDGTGNVIRQVARDGVTTGYEYESNYNQVTEFTLPNGHVQSFQYDSRGNLIRTSQGTGNVALKRTASASTVFNGSATFEASQAVDDDGGAGMEVNDARTRWSSANANQPQWIRVDLGSSFAIEGVRLAWHSVQFAEAYEIQVSNDETFGTSTSIFSTTNGDGGIDNLWTMSAASGRYVRMYATVTHGTAYSLHNFEIFGSPNIADGKSATAFSQSGSDTSANALDGNYSTNWVSNFATGTTQWLRVDLGTTQAISGARLHWGATQYGTQYQIQVSDDINFTSGAYSVVFDTAISGAGNGDLDDLENLVGTGRYLRLYMTAGDSITYRLKEFEVFGNPVLSTNRAASASSVWSSAGFEADKAFDASSTTRWSSLNVATPQKLQVDLGSEHAIGGARIVWHSNHATAYRIETSSNAADWTIVHETTTGNGNTENINNLSGVGRYVRLHMLTPAEGIQAYSVYDFQVFGTALTNAYDARGNVTAQTAAKGNLQNPDANHTTRYTYDASGLLLTQTTPIGTGVSNAYDTTGRGHLLTASHLVPQQSPQLAATYTYDLLGHALSTTIPGTTGVSPESVTSQRWIGPRLSSATDGQGHTTTFHYDRMERQTRVINPDGTFTQATYDALGNVLTATDERGRVTEYFYDARNRLIQTLHADQALNRFSYDGAGRVVATTDPLGNTTTHAYTYQNQQEQTGDLTEVVTSPEVAAGVALVTSRTHDDITGQLLKEEFRKSTDISAWSTTQYTIDLLGRVTKVLGPENHVATMDYDANGKLIRQARYDVTGISTPSDPRTLDPARRRTVSTLFDSLDRPIEVIDAAGQSTHTSYDFAGRVHTTTDARDAVTTREYDAAGRLKRLINPDADGNPATTNDIPITLYEYDANGNVVAITDPRSHKTTFEYDALNRKTKEELPDADGNPATTGDAPKLRYEYDVVGNVVAVIDPRLFIAKSDYDAMNRKVREISPDPDGVGGPLRPSVTTFDYDRAGNLVTMVDPRGNDIGTDPALFTTSYQYDALNRKVMETLPDLDGISATDDKAFTTYIYDRNDLASVSMTDPLADETRTTSYTYDRAGRKLTETLPDPDGAGQPLTSPVTSWIYDALGQLTSVTNARLNTTSYEYDKLGRTIRETGADPDGDGVATPNDAPITRYEYDENGNLERIIHPRGNVPGATTGLYVTEYEHDFLNRKIEERSPDADENINTTSDIAITKYQYDLNGNLKNVINPLGNLSGANAALHTTVYEYDALNRKTTETLPSADNDTQTADAPVIEHKYDVAGNVVEMIDPMGRVTSYAYDGLGRSIRQTLPDPDGAGTSFNPAATTWHYDVAGNVIATVDALGNDVPADTKGQRQALHATRFEYDGLNNQIKETLPDADGRPVATAADSPVTLWDYNAFGELESYTDAAGNVTGYEYDNLGRMLSETNALSDSRVYEYDASGNVTKITDRNNEVREFVYDKLDRQEKEKWLDGSTVVRTFETRYDVEGRVSSVTEKDAASAVLTKMAYTYDGVGRVKSEDNDGTANLPRVILTHSYDVQGRRTGLASTVNGTADFTNVYTYDNLDRMGSVQQSAAGVETIKAEFDHDNSDAYTEIRRYTGTTLSATSSYNYDLAGRLFGLHHTIPFGGGSYTYYQYFQYDVAWRMTSFSHLDGTETYLTTPTGNSSAPITPTSGPTIPTATTTTAIARWPGMRPTPTISSRMRWCPA